MRENWIKYQLKDIIEKLYDGPHATPSPSDEGPIFLGIKNLTNDGRFNFDGIRHIANEDFPRWTKRVLPSKDDIVFTYEATLHRYGLIPENMVCCLGRRMGLLRLDKKKVYPSFILLYFQSPEWKQIIERNIIVGATVNRIPISEMPEFPLFLPKLSEQKAIAKVLSDLDAKIELNNKINAELEGMAKLIYDYWFVQFDFPNKEGKPYKSSGGKMIYNEALKREIPLGWEVKELSNVESNIITGKTPSTKVPENFNGKVPFICIGDVRGNMHITKTELTLTKKGADSQLNKYIPKGAICVTCIASPGLVAFATEESQTNQQLNSIVCDKVENQYFLYFYLKDYFRFSKAKTGNTFANMNKGDFSVIKTLQPQFEILSRFTEQVEPSICEVLALLEENQQLSQLRDWLLPMLMNGQVTVKEAEEHIDMAAESAGEYKKNYTMEEEELLKYVIKS